MEEEATINNVFSKNIYKTHLKDHKKINKVIKPLVESFVKEKPGSVAATTDVEGNTNFTDLNDAKDNLQLDIEYEDLFKSLCKHINAFLNAKGYDMEKFDAHITKAWATYTAQNQHIASHKHTASHFSCVYYVHNEDMGNIRFEEELAAQTGLFIPPTDQYIKEWNQFNFASYTFPVKTGDFVIFPSILLHQTETNLKPDPRISISGDIILTMKKGVSTEHCLPHTDMWRTT